MFKATISGRLGSDPEMRYTPAGEPVCNFRIAHNFKKGELVQVAGNVTFSYWTDATQKQRKSCDLRAQALGQVALPAETESEF